jgi:hypothetical protein
MWRGAYSPFRSAFACLTMGIWRLSDQIGSDFLLCMDDILGNELLDLN